MPRSRTAKGNGLDRLPVKTAEEIRLLPVSDIAFCRAEGGHTVVVTGSGDLRTRFRLAELEVRLEPWGFFRAHRAYVVNLHHVDRITAWSRNTFTLFLHDKREVPLSKHRMRSLRELLGW